MSKSLFFSFAYYLSYILCARIQKPQQSRLHRKCCNVCTQSSSLAGPVCSRVWLHHLYVSLLAYLSSNKCSTLSSPQAPVGKITWILWLNLKDKVQRGGWHNRRKGPSIQLCPFSLFYLLRLAGLSHQSLGVFSSCEFLGLLLWWSDRMRKRQCGEWIREFCRMINAQPLGGQARVRTHIAGVTHTHQSLHLKQRASPHAMHMKDAPRWNDFFFSKKAQKVAWMVSWQYNYLKMYVALFSHRYNKTQVWVTQKVFCFVHSCTLSNKPAFSVMPRNWMASQHGWPCSESTRHCCFPPTLFLCFSSTGPLTLSHALACVHCPFPPIITHSQSFCWVSFYPSLSFLSFHCTVCVPSHISQLTHSHPLSTRSPSQSGTLRHFPSPNSGTF